MSCTASASAPLIAETAAEIASPAISARRYSVAILSPRNAAAVAMPVDAATYEEMLRSHDDGVAEFLDLARVKENTLGNTRMLAKIGRAHV